MSVEPIPQPAAEPASPSKLIDTFGRAIYYVRISVTDRCNLRCRYCMPREAPEWIENETLLSFDEIERFVRVAAAEGVRKIRLTGGEPLVRRDLPELIRRVAAVPGIHDLGMTTNATLLEKHAGELKTAGLTRLNISLDSLQRERFAFISKFDSFEQVWAGIQKALEVGFAPLKINVVVIRGFNEDELVDFALLTKQFPFFVRFIEYMPIGGDLQHWSRDKVVPCAEIRSIIEQHEQLQPVEIDAVDAGPERVFRLRNSVGRVAFISPVSDEFCARCNRIRLTSDGKVRGCLMRDGEVDFRKAFRDGASDDQVRDLLHEVMRRKPEKHLINSPDFKPSAFYTMNRLGG
jgi:GTP 3',8-cyclase